MPPWPTRGIREYEVSNFAAATAHRSRHNLKYWNHVPYLGLGPSAHSFDGGRRWWNRRKLRRWQREVDAGVLPIEGDERLSSEDLALETLIFGLRSSAGIDLAAFEQRFAVDLVSTNHDAVEEYESRGILKVEGAKLRPTVAGMAIADAVARTLEVSTTTKRRPYTL